MSLMLVDGAAQFDTFVDLLFVATISYCGRALSLWPSVGIWPFLPSVSFSEFLSLTRELCTQFEWVHPLWCRKQTKHGKKQHWGCLGCSLLHRWVGWARLRSLSKNQGLMVFQGFKGRASRRHRGRLGDWMMISGLPRKFKRLKLLLNKGRPFLLHF